MTGRHVVVVGGGLAGLSAAVECADRGARVTVLERQRSLGGLTRSFEHSGLCMDNGQHVFLACCHAYRQFMGRIGSAKDLRGPRPLDLPVAAPAAPGCAPRYGRIRRTPGLPAPLHVSASLLRYPHLGLTGRMALGRALAGLARLDLEDPRLDRISFGEWLRARGQSDDAVETVWDLITIPTVNLPADEASLATAAMVFRTGLMGGASAADMGWSAVPLGVLHGERAAATLRRAGAAVHTGVRVEEVRHERRWEVLTGDGMIDADAVILALPHGEASRLAPTGAWPTQARWADLGNSAVVDVHLVFDRRVTGWEVMGAVRSPVQWVFDRSSAAGLADGAKQYLAVSISAADHLLDRRPEEVVKGTLSSLGDLLPAVRAAVVVDSLVTKERKATFRAAPGALAARPSTRGSFSDLAIAGAWTDTGWPATMEGAVRSGMAAADAVMARESRRRPAPAQQTIERN